MVGGKELGEEGRVEARGGIGRQSLEMISTYFNGQTEPPLPLNLDTALTTLKS